MVKFGSWEHAEGQGFLKNKSEEPWLEFGQGTSLCHTSGSVWGGQQLRTVSDGWALNHACSEVSFSSVCSVSTYDNGDKK